MDVLIPTSTETATMHARSIMLHIDCTASHSGSKFADVESLFVHDGSAVISDTTGDTVKNNRLRVTGIWNIGIWRSYEGVFSIGLTSVRKKFFRLRVQ